MNNVIPLFRKAPPAVEPAVPPIPQESVSLSAHVGIEASMLSALHFYASQGFDHGVRARAVLHEIIAPSNPQEQA